MTIEAKSRIPSAARFIPISSIRCDGGTQPREAIDDAVVAEYAERLIEGDLFPPVTVFYDGTDYWLGDGFHRVAGHDAAELTDVACEVRQGTRRDAVLFSVGANGQHGLPRTNSDKRRAVATLLTDPEWGGWTDSEIARRCRVSHPYVAKVRAEVSPETVTGERSYTTKHGTPATMDVSGITAAAAERKQVNPTPNVPTPADVQAYRDRKADEPAPGSLNGGVPSGTPAAPAEPETAAVEDFGDNIASELEHADAEIRRLQDLVESLSKSDLGQQVRDWSLKYDQLNGRLQQAITTGNEAVKQATRQGDLLKKIRKALGVKENTEILSAIEQRSVF
jgi:hypothetical protein